MRYELEYANSFKKDLKTCKKRGYNLTLLQEVIDLLQTTGTLPERYRPHKLSGSYEGLWECHIKGDWLLIWQQNDTELILIMTDTGTHADLSSYLRHRYRLCLIRFINSSRVLACWKNPVKSEVVVREFCFSTPRICMHICCASITTITPNGSSVS